MAPGDGAEALEGGVGCAPELAGFVFRARAAVGLGEGGERVGFEGAAEAARAWATTSSRLLEFRVRVRDGFKRVRHDG